MMKYLLGCACAVAMIHAVRAEECTTHKFADFAAQVKAAAESVGDAELTLEGDQAKRFLAYVNNEIGEPTTYEGDAIVIRLHQAPPMALMVLAKHDCMVNPPIVLSAAAFTLAYRAAHGQGM